VAERTLAADETMHAPHLLDVEVAQVLRRYARTGEVDEERCREALDDLAVLRVERHRHDILLKRVWELRHHISAYDAVYVALAETLASPVVTCDRPLSRTTGHEAEIELIEARS
jgi:predicted nucleic acid-binding protein